MSAQLRAVCEFCPRRSRWQEEDPEYPGRVSPWELAVGWSVAPYSLGFEHPDGTHGDKWTCPACDRAIRAGARMRARAVECTERRVCGTAGERATSVGYGNRAGSGVAAAQRA